MPRVFVGGACIGGGDETTAAARNGTLEKKVKAASKQTLRPMGQAQVRARVQYTSKYENLVLLASQYIFMARTILGT